MTKFILVTLSLVLLTNCQGKTNSESAQNTHPMYSPDGSKIAYINNEVGTGNNNPVNFEVYIMNNDGSNSVRYTFNNAFEADISWSLDGKKLAVKSYRDGNDEVYIIDINSKKQINISNNSSFDGCPFWSANGEFVFFQSERDHKNGELYSYSLQTKKVQRLTNNEFLESSAVWSPNGSTIAFVSNKDGDDDIYIMDSIGENLLQLTNNELNDWYPQWSPDGRSIIFTYGDWETDVWEVRIINVDGTDEKTLIKQTDSGNASWHPDGIKIAFSSAKLGASEIYTYNLKTKKEIQITTGNNTLYKK